MPRGNSSLRDKFFVTALKCRREFRRGRPEAFRSEETSQRLVESRQHQQIRMVLERHRTARDAERDRLAVDRTRVETVCRICREIVPVFIERSSRRGDTGGNRYGC